jgi:predicted nucleic acid-binding protein
MIVVADTSPLNYLIQIECERLLNALYKRIVVPQSVMTELGHSGAPSIVRGWLEHLPEWIEIHALSSPPDKTLEFLGPGEREAIQLSEQLKTDLLLIDERKGRLEARRRGLRTTGTLGVLLSAFDLDLIDPEKPFHRLLRETTFRITPELEAKFLAQIRRERRP